MAIKKVGKPNKPFLLDMESWWLIFDGQNLQGAFVSEKLKDPELDMNSIAECAKFTPPDKFDKKYKEKKAEYDKQTEPIYSRVADSIVKVTEKRPISLRRLQGKNKTELIFCIYKGIIYKCDRAGYTEEEMLLQIMDLEDEERRKFERLRHKFSVAEKEEKEGKRPAVPEEVRIAVWRRDDGKCLSTKRTSRSCRGDGNFDRRADSTCFHLNYFFAVTR